jgi:hypothetical protein
MVDLTKHKIYVDSHKMDMVPLSVAIQAVKEASTPEVENYAEEFEKAMAELRNSINNIKLDD